MLKKGFTLIEILVVVAILGILASIVTFMVSGYRESARDTARVTDLQELSLALSLYRDAHGSYPADLSDLVPDFSSTEPVDPLGNPYTYEVLGSPPAHYLLLTEFENADNVPADSATGPVLGHPCGDTNYCVSTVPPVI